IPPKPVTALRSVNFEKRLPLLRLIKHAGVDLPLQKRTCFAEQIPRAIFFVLANPDIEVARNPRAGVERGELTLRRIALKIVLNCATRQPFAFLFNAAVKSAQK